MSGVTVSVDAFGVAELVMCRTEARNALSTEQADQIASAAIELNSRPDVRVVVMSSADPRFFSVGADLKERRSLDEPGLLAARGHSTAATQALLDLAVPTLAAVSGMALGGGLELALTCDVVVADSTALVGLPETGVGIIPGGGGTQLLPRRIGIGRAAELIFTGRRLSAAEAHGYGIVDVLVDDDAVGAALQLATTIAAKSPNAQRNAKAALRNGQDRPLAEALSVEDGQWRSSACSADYREGLAAFAEKRPPDWPSPSLSPVPPRTTGDTP
ncbi:enoyl-CoA hydratase-related protein [Mycobacterium sp. ACS4331]|uniref:enoyl-CoA hydratase/isomerase family protein n=1 Tax=Mycobacterium sp. ACS4331 TaxID=1834121 RepID=UPI000B11EBB1|nr:enoyl-CoA hydratase-related protein [Mycobacterium sp. ACS4331]